MKPSTGILVTLKNLTASAVGGLPANSEKVVFLSPSWSWADRQAILAGLSSGAVVGLDLSGAQIPTGAVGAEVLELASTADALASELSGASALAKLALRTSWNMNAAPLMIAAVRADMLATGLVASGTSASAVLAKLQGVCTLIGLGMFEEAAATMQSVTPDGYLTTARLSLYAQMLAAANAIA